MLFNTLMYGSIAFILSAYFAYAKYLNLAISGFMILAAYVLAVSTTHWRWVKQIAILLCAFLLYRCINYIILHYFKNEKQRDLFWLIFTLGCSIVVDNSIAIIYGSSPVSIEGWWLSRWELACMLIVLQLLIIYIFQKSFLGKIWQGIYSNTWSIRTLGIPVNTMIHILFCIFFVCSMWLALLVAQQWAIKPSDHLFYTLKWIGIMIAVWVDKRQYMYLWALFYVILEYILFVVWWVPLGYKEALILIIILILLLLKPEWLFSFKQRVL